MYDSETVLKGLECHMDLVKSERWASGCISCPFGEMDHCIEHLLNATIELVTNGGTNNDQKTSKKADHVL